jgi:nitrate reductase gamma subunit
MITPAWALLAMAQDSVAYVAQKSGPPATESYMWAGYAITLVTLLGYVALMARRISKSKNG